MTKKNEKRLCWNCEGSVSHHLDQCPYCGVDVTAPPPRDEHSLFKGFASPFQKAPQQDVPAPPYARVQNSQLNVTDEEWNTALNEEKNEEEAPSAKQEMVAFLLLLPGIVFFLFGLALTLFSTDGMLTLQWNQNVAYFYFIGSLPLLYLGWRLYRKI